MNLSVHFTLEELSATTHRDVDNTPPGMDIGHLHTLAKGLEDVRTLLDDLPIHINSGYRSPELNRLVGGSLHSAHMDGYAADFICPQFGTPYEICELLVKSNLKFDQIIQEGTWVHLSFAPAMRRDVLTKAAAGGYKKGL